MLGFIAASLAATGIILGQAGSAGIPGSLGKTVAPSLPNNQAAGGAAGQGGGGAAKRSGEPAAVAQLKKETKTSGVAPEPSERPAAIKAATQVGAEGVNDAFQQEPNEPLIIKVYSIRRATTVGLRHHRVEGAQLPVVRLPTSDSRMPIRPAESQGSGEGGALGGGVDPLGFGGGGLIANDEDLNSYCEDMRSMIEQNIEKESWITNGGTGEIMTFQGRLIVKQTRSNQQKVDEFIRQLSSPVEVEDADVVIRAYWLNLAGGHDHELRKLQEKWNESPKLAEEADSAFKDLCSQTLRYSGEIRCRPGQTVHFSSGETRSFAYDLTPVISQSVIGYQPKVSVVQLGATLEVRVLSADYERTSIDVIGTVVEPRAALFGKKAGDGSEEPAPFSANSPTLDRVNLRTQRIASTVTTKRYAPVVVGRSTTDVNDLKNGSLTLVIQAVQE